jgi:hypothetical protein
VKMVCSSLQKPAVSFLRFSLVPSSGPVLSLSLAYIKSLFSRRYVFSPSESGLKSAADITEENDFLPSRKLPRALQETT